MGRHSLKHLIIVGLGTLFISACGSGTDSGVPDLVGGPGASPTPTPAIVGNVVNDRFFVAPYVDPATSVVYETHSRLASDFSTPCEIASTSTDQDLACIIDAKEADLITQGISLMYNVPADMCAYLERETYWYYNYEVGVGPSDIVIQPIFDANDEYTGTANCSVNGSGLSACTNVNFPELQFDLSDETPKFHCVYDHTDAGEDRDGPNCCLGEYVVTIDEDHSAAAVDEVQSITFSAVPASGNWTLDFDGRITAVLAHNITAPALQTALEALSNIAPGDVAVAGDFVTGFTFTFSGNLAATDVAELELASNTLLDGGAVAVTATESTGTEGVTPDEDSPTPSQETAWGGSISACLGGPGKSSWSDVTKGEGPTRYGYPSVSIMHTGTGGINDVYTVNKLIPNRSSSVSIANFHVSSDIISTDPDSHNHTGFVSISSSNVPYFVNPIDDRDGTPFNDTDRGIPGNAIYDFRCLNAAGEVRNRLRVYIRDWDDEIEFDDYISSSGASGDPDTGATGTEVEGTDCLGVFAYCNDGFDLDDFLNITNGGIYDTATESNRYQLFPMEYYP